MENVFTMKDMKSMKKEFSPTSREVIGSAIEVHLLLILIVDYSNMELKALFYNPSCSSCSSW